MQKLAIAAALTVVSLATLHGANAADMSARPMAYTPPPPPPPVFSWTGFYIGANGGGGSAQNNFNSSQSGVTTVPGVGAFPFTNAASGNEGLGGGIAGGQIGFNWEFPLSHVVIGIEADGDWADINGLNNSCSTITGGAAVFAVGSTAGCATVNSRLNSFETVRGRLGYAFTTNSVAFPSLLLYATGGGAWGHVNGNANLTCLGPLCPTTSAPFNGGSAGFDRTENGWTAGAGFETAIYGHWTGRLEYLHMQFPNGSTNFNTVTGSGTSTITAATHISSNTGVDVVRVGVNYLFNFGGPAYAY